MNDFEKKLWKKQKCCFTSAPNSERVFMHNKSIIHEKSQDWRVNWYFGGSWKFKRRYTAQILGGNPWLSWWFTSLAWIHFLPHNSPSLPSSNWQHAIAAAAADKWDSGFLSMFFTVSNQSISSLFSNVQKLNDSGRHVTSPLLLSSRSGSSSLTLGCKKVGLKMLLQPFLIGLQANKRL